jgi:hypothetical protein
VGTDGMGVMDNLQVAGHLRYIIRNEETGKIREYEFDNIATNGLLNMVAQAISKPLDIAKYQMGTGSGSVAKTDVALFTPLVGSIINLAIRTAQNNQITITINYPRNVVSGTFTEGGLLSSVNALLTHVILTPAISIVANESVTIIYTLTIN